MLGAGDGSYVGHSPGDSLCGSDLSLDDSAGFDQLDDGQSLSGVDLHDIQSQHHGVGQAVPTLGLDIGASTSPHHVASLGGHHLHHQHAGAAAAAAAAEMALSTPSYHPINPIDKLYLMQNAYFRLDQ